MLDLAIREVGGLRGGREYLTGDERDEVETEESFARAASLASRRSFSFRARWTSSRILGSEGGGVGVCID